MNLKFGVSSSFVELGPMTNPTILGLVDGFEHWRSPTKLGLGPMDWRSSS